MWKWVEMANKGNWSESALREVLLSICNSICLIACRWTLANLVYTSSPPNLQCMAFSTMVVLAFQKEGTEMSGARLFSLTEWTSQLGRSLVVLGVWFKYFCFWSMPLNEKGGLFQMTISFVPSCILYLSKKNTHWI